MTATATVEVAKKENVLRIPNQAFIVSPVEVEENTRAKYVWIKALSVGRMPVNRVEVKTGLVGDYYTELLSDNLKEGDEILVGIRKKIDVKDEVSSYEK